MGAWIETESEIFGSLTRTSHPTWVRGLKLFKHITVVKVRNVAPYMGAWIETNLVPR